MIGRKKIAGRAVPWLLPCIWAGAFFVDPILFH